VRRRGPPPGKRSMAAKFSFNSAGRLLPELRKR